MLLAIFYEGLRDLQTQKTETGIVLDCDTFFLIIQLSCSYIILKKQSCLLCKPPIKSGRWEGAIKPAVPSLPLPPQRRCAGETPGARCQHPFLCPPTQVNLVSEHIWCEDFLVRSFYLKNMRTSETRTVTQFHFLSWYDRGVPSSTRSLLDFRRYTQCPAGRVAQVGVHGRCGRHVALNQVAHVWDAVCCRTYDLFYIYTPQMHLYCMEGREIILIEQSNCKMFLVSEVLKCERNRYFRIVEMWS